MGQQGLEHVHSTVSAAVMSAGSPSAGGRIWIGAALSSSSIIAADPVVDASASGVTPETVLPP